MDDDGGADIPVAPLADMVFLLLAFLVCVAVLRSGAALDLPETSSTAPAVAPRGASLALTLQEGAGDVGVALDGRAEERVPCDPEAVAAAIRRITAGEPAGEIAIRADAGVPYHRVRALLRGAQLAGATEASIAGRPSR